MDESLWLPQDGALIHRRLAPRRPWYSFTYPGSTESWVSLGEKEGRTNVQISANPGIELGTLWLEGRDLTNYSNRARPWKTRFTRIATVTGRSRSYQMRQACCPFCSTAKHFYSGYLWKAESRFGFSINQSVNQLINLSMYLFISLSTLSKVCKPTLLDGPWCEKT